MWRYFTMIYLIIITWYLIGSIGLIWIGRQIDGRTTRKDLIVGFTIGGLGGLITWLIGIPHLMKSDWMDKDVF
jgi:hypothetical protein